MSGPLLRLLARRYALGCGLTALVPIVLGLVAGNLWPQYREQFAALDKFTAMKFVRVFLRDDLIPPQSSTFLFQLPFMHPVTMLALIVAMALPTLAWPAGARGRGTLDLVLATPLERGTLVATTFVFTLPFALLHAAAPLLGTWLGGTLAGVADELPFALFFQVSFESFALALFFSGLALLLSVGLAPRRALRGPEAGGALAALACVVLWSLLAEIVATMWTRASWLKGVTPFGWFEPPQVLAGVTSPWRDGGVLLASGLLCAALAWRNERARRSA
jgi:hypothetical protein